MTVLITGAGLVGSQVARLEQEAGRTPVIFDVAPRVEALADFVDLDRCTIVRGDVTNPLDLVGAIEAHGVRRIAHCAALGGLTTGSNAAPLTSTLVNFMGSAYVLEAARVLKLDRVVLCSSSAVYLSAVGGEDGGEYGYEEAFPRPNNVYAANKQAAEDLGRAYQNTFGVDVVAVRFAAVFGPWRFGGGGQATTAVERWVRAGLAGEPGEVEFSGGDWLYSKDAAQGVFKALWLEDPTDRLFNLGMGEHVTKDDIARAINAAVPGAKATAAADQNVVASSQISDGAAAGITMNIDRARKQLGYEVEFPMDKAIADYAEWLRASGA